VTTSGRKFLQLEYGSPAYRASVALRYEVLRKPLGLNFTDEELEKERDYFLLACHDHDDLLACLMLVPQSSTDIRVRQVAVSPQIQRQGVGRGLMEFAEDFARQQGFTKATLNARDTALPFYERLGYERVGEPFEEVTIMHFAMQKEL